MDTDRSSPYDSAALCLVVTALFVILRGRFGEEGGSLPFGRPVGAGLPTPAAKARPWKP